MSERQMLHVVADANGTIVAAALHDTGSQHPSGAQVQLTPMEGQAVVVVPLSSELGRLASEADFRRLRNEFHVPPGKGELVRKHRDPDRAEDH